MLFDVTKITEAHAAHYREHGYAVVDNFLDARDQCFRILVRCDFGRSRQAPLPSVH